jgi:pimeloyl-ACP methyl ester carboxylesterase
VAHWSAETNNVVAVGGRLVHYDRWGTGIPPVVFESGLASPAFVWKPVAAALAGETTVVAYDRPGYGRSEPGRRPRTTQQVARELGELIETLGLGSCVLVGHSFGAIVIDALASMAPGLVAGLVLVESGDPHAFVGDGSADGAVFRRYRRAMRVRALPYLVPLGLAHARLARVTARHLPPVRSALRPLIDRIPPFWDDAAATLHPRYFRAVFDELWSWPDSIAAAGPGPTRVEVPVAVLTSTHHSLAESLVRQSWRNPRPRLPAELLAALRRAEAFSANWTWQAVEGPHELPVTSPDQIAAATLDVVRAVRRGTKLDPPAALPLATDEVQDLAAFLGDRPRLLLNSFGSEPATARRYGANDAAVAELARRSTRRVLAAWARAWGECTSIEPVGASDYGWTLVVSYRAVFASGITATLDAHLDEARMIADVVTRD